MAWVKRALPPPFVILVRFSAGFFLAPKYALLRRGCFLTTLWCCDYCHRDMSDEASAFATEQTFRLLTLP
jgi:hypothetical protein